MIIDGRKIAANVLEDLKKEVANLSFKPLFCDVLVGEDAVSMSYVKIKGRSAEQIGIGFKLVHFSESLDQKELIDEIKKLNHLPNICGLIVQLPLPRKFSKQAILDAIEPEIDVDCIGSITSKKFYQGDLSLVPPTAAAVMKMLDGLNLDLSKKNILVVGQGQLVGKPVSFLFEKRDLKVNIADKFTKNIPELIKQADIIISATGQPKLITGDKIKAGSIVIDAGTAESDGGIVGDVDLESVSKIAGDVSPVPGGVGPVTVSMLLKNVLIVAKQK